MHCLHTSALYNEKPFTCYGKSQNTPGINDFHGNQVTVYHVSMLSVIKLRLLEAIAFVFIYNSVMDTLLRNYNSYCRCLWIGEFLPL